MMAAVYTPRLLILYGTILLLFSIVIRISFYKLKRKKINIKKDLLVNLFMFYLICLISITLLPITIYYIKAPYIITPNINFVPFYGILDYTSSKILLFNTLGNLILFVPFMIFIEILKDGKVSLLKGLFLILICSLLIEGIQYIEMYFQLAERIVDINDVILNLVVELDIIYIYHYLKTSLSIKIQKLKLFKLKMRDSYCNIAISLLNCLIVKVIYTCNIIDLISTLSIRFIFFNIKYYFKALNLRFYIIKIP